MVASRFSLRSLVIVPVAVLSVLSAAWTGVSTADTEQPGKNWISKARVQQILVKDGFSQITGIHARHGKWEGRGIEDGVSYRFEVEPQSGKLKKMRLPGAGG